MISEKSLFFGGSRAQFHKCNVMDSQSLVLYGHPTSSDIPFMLSDSQSLSLYSLSSTSSTRSDAQSAPPDFGGILDRISNESIMWIERSGRKLPPEWTMPDLVRAVLSDDRIDRA